MADKYTRNRSQSLKGNSLFYDVWSLFRRRRRNPKRLIVEGRKLIDTMTGANEAARKLIEKKIEEVGNAMSIAEARLDDFYLRPMARYFLGYYPSSRTRKCRMSMHIAAFLSTGLGITQNE